MNKLIITLLFTILSVVGFSQDSFRSDNDFSTPSYENTAAPSRMETMSEQDPTTSGIGDGNDGGQFAPIDDYQYYLLGLGVLLTGIVVYRRNQLQKA